VEEVVHFVCEVDVRLLGLLLVDSADALQLLQAAHVLPLAQLLLAQTCAAHALSAVKYYQNIVFQNVLPFLNMLEQSSHLELSRPYFSME
jgi:hypothetical protein